MEAIGQLTGGVAHDFNNLLTVIIGGLDAALRHLDQLPAGPEQARIRRSCAMGQHAARRAATLTTKLLAFSRRQILDPRSIDANALVNGVADLLQELSAKPSRSRLFRRRSVARIRRSRRAGERAAEPGRQRSRRNDSGRTIDDRNLQHIAGRGVVATIPEPVQPGQYVMIAVSDTGQGMDESTLARVFEPLHDEGSGQGNRPGPEPGLRIRAAERRAHPHLLGARRGHYREDLPAASVGCSRRNRSRAESRDVAGRHRRARARGRGSRRSANVQRQLAAGTGLSGAQANRAGALEILQNNHDVALLFTDVVLPDGMHGRGWPTKRCGAYRISRCCSRPATRATISSTKVASIQACSC